MTTETLSDQNDVTFEQFREEWLREILDEEMSSFEKGQKFAFKIVTQWLNVDEGDEDLKFCDGSRDGGIDIAYLRRSDVDDDDDAQDNQFINGDTWYLFQSKYGTSFQGTSTIYKEGKKVITTLSGGNDRISEKTRDLLVRLDEFKARSSESDRIILVFATDNAMSESDRQALHDLRILGKERLGSIFDVEDISLETIWESKIDESHPVMSLSLKGNFVDPSPGLKVGTVSLSDLYEFLKTYRIKTGNLDQIYEKNIRQFLGGRGKVNKGIAETLKENPQMFGLYNNGITIVVSDFSPDESMNSCILSDPHIVNGCQTTRTLWEILNQRLEAGGTKEIEASGWHEGIKHGVVVTKIVKSDSTNTEDITRYTNSQTAVRAQDFLALSEDFADLAEKMNTRYDIFLEIQRAGWDAQRARQKSHPSSEKQFTKYVNVLDLLKVYGAGWLCEPGRAYASNAPFLPPRGAIFRRMIKIDADDLYAAYKLKELADQYEFGRGSNVKLSRRVTRFFYYFIVIDLLKDVLIKGNHSHSYKDITQAFLSLLRNSDEYPREAILDAAIQVVDEYLSQESGYSVFKESEFKDNMNQWFKSENIGKGEEYTSRLNDLLWQHKNLFSRGSKGQESPMDLVNRVISEA